MFFQGTSAKPVIGTDKSSQIVDLRGFDETNAYADMQPKETPGTF